MTLALRRRDEILANTTCRRAVDIIRTYHSVPYAEASGPTQLSIARLTNAGDAAKSRDHANQLGHCPAGECPSRLDDLGVQLAAPEMGASVKEPLPAAAEAACYSLSPDRTNSTLAATICPKSPTHPARPQFSTATTSAAANTAPATSAFNSMSGTSA